MPDPVKHVNFGQGIAAYNSTPPTFNEGEIGGLQVDINGNLKVYIVGAAGGSTDTELPTAALLADDTANPTAPAVGAFNMVYDGATWDRLRGTAADGMLVNLGANNDVTVTGTVAVTQSGSWILSANSGVDIGDVTINNASGASAVNIQDGGNSITIDGSITTVTTVTTVSTLTSITNWGNVVDNAAFTDGTTRVLMAGFIYDEVAGTALTENDAAAARINVNRAQVHTIEDGVTRGRYATVSASNALKVDGSAVTQPVSGTVTANLAAGTNNIGDVDVLSIIPGTSATSLGKAEDAVHATGDTGVFVLAVRSDAGGAFGADGDYVPFSIDANGALRVTGGGGGTEYTEDIAAPSDPVGGTLMMTRDDQLAALTEIEGDWTRLRATAKGALWVALADSSGDPITSFGGGTQYAVDTALGATPTGTLAVAIRDDALSALTPVEGDAIGLRVDANGALWVKHSGVISVDDNGGALTVDGTVAISGTVTVAAHAVTNAGTFAVQESGAALTALQLIDDTVVVLGTDVYTEATSKGLVMGAVRRDADTTLVGTTNEFGPLQMDANGRLKVEAFSGETLPVSLASVPSHAVTNAGTFAVQVDGAALTALQLLDDTVFTDNAAFTVGTSKVHAFGLMADETSPDSVDEGDVGIPRMTLDRKQITTAYAHAAGGSTPYKLISAASTNATSVKASAGTLYSITASNINAAARYLKIYNKASAPTVGTDTPVLVFLIPGNTAGAGTNIPIGLPGYEFTTGIAFALTTGAADSDTGAVAASEIIVNLGYK